MPNRKSMDLDGSTYIMKINESSYVTFYNYFKVRVPHHVHHWRLSQLSCLRWRCLDILFRLDLSIIRHLGLSTHPELYIPLSCLFTIPSNSSFHVLGEASLRPSVGISFYRLLPGTIAIYLVLKSTQHNSLFLAVTLRSDPTCSSPCFSIPCH